MSISTVRAADVPLGGLLLALFSAAACGLLGRSLFFNYGTYSARALICVLAAGLSGVTAVMLPTAWHRRLVARRWEAVLASALAVLVLYQIRLGWSDGPFHGGEPLRRSQMLLAGIGVGVVLAAVARRSSVWTLSLAVVGVCAAALYALLLVAVRPPFIDVFMFQQEGARALLSFHDPYALRFRNIYGHPWYYGPALVDGSELKFGFPYPPVSLLISTLGYAIARDHRWAQAAAAVASGVLMGAGGGRLGMLMGAVLLTTPRGLFVVESGWTEPFAVAALCVVVFLASRRSRWVFPALGLFWAVKQYLLLTIPLAWLLLTDAQRMWICRREWRRCVQLATWTIVPAAALTLPFAVWHPRSFWFDMVPLHVLHPFRPDGLSVLSLWARHGTPVMTNALGFAAAVAALALVLWRAPRSAAGFATAAGLVLLAFFVVNKAAFANYYYFVLGCFACASAFAFADAATAAAGADGGPHFADA